MKKIFNPVFKNLQYYNLRNEKALAGKQKSDAFKI